ncbi:MAG: DUF4430 domain-containing protein [Eubacteriales bacterium]
MKQANRTRLSLVLLVLVLGAAVTLALLLRGGRVDKTGLWEDAKYLRDKSFGSGEITVEVEVKAGNQSITFTIKTDKTTLGEALLEHDLIEGEQTNYGLYVTKVNGIVADFEVDESYWALYRDGEMMMAGVDTTEIENGEHYELVHTNTN